MEEYDASIPNTGTEELLACIHILYLIYNGDYAAVDKWLFSSCANMDGDVPIDQIRDGEGLVVLEYLREVREKQRTIANGGIQ